MNEHDDPFFSSSSDDRTVIRPVPGGRYQDIKRPSEAAFSNTTSAINLQKLGKVNPLESAASSLLALISQLYHSPSHSEPQQLKQQLTKELNTFRTQAEAAGYDSKTLTNASYSLCTTIDEAIFNTPWGRQSGWGEQSLLSIFHGEVSGGEEFFLKLKTNMSTTLTITDKIKEYVKESATVPSGFELLNNTLLFDEGLFDSMGFMALISFLQEEFDTQPNDDELIVENFESIDAITSYLSKKLA